MSNDEVRIINYPITCANCGNRALMCDHISEDKAKTNKGCDLWVPSDFYDYDDHYVQFRVPEWVQFNRLSNLNPSMLIDGLSDHTDLYRTVGVNEKISITTDHMETFVMKGPGVLLFVKTEDES